MKASLKDFITTGSFGLLDLGASRSFAEQHIGSPDAWGADAKNYQTSSIWKYGDVEFHFQKDELYMIFMDEFLILSGGDKIDLDVWGINGDLTCIAAEQLLSSAGIPYRKEDFPFNNNDVHLITGAGAVLTFNDENASNITLSALHRQIVD